MEKLILFSERCKGCAMCIHFCPKEILSASDKVNLLGYTYTKVDNEDECSQCKNCELVCPDMAIKVMDRQRSTG
jgi:2-oxoglutarate ferredoxin oxidoreductase subunit delta